MSISSLSPVLCQVQFYDSDKRNSLNTENQNTALKNSSSIHSNYYMYIVLVQQCRLNADL